MRKRLETEWLDTETKALLQQAPPEKLAPPHTGKFTLVMLKRGADTARVVAGLTRLPGMTRQRAEPLVAKSCPVPVASSLSIADAILGQFELVCCDSASVFLRDGVVATASGSYLSDLYSQLRQSSEFEEVIVTVTSIPCTSEGERIARQFFGGGENVRQDAENGYSYAGAMMRKKARILDHWARKVGSQVAIADDV